MLLPFEGILLLGKQPEGAVDLHEASKAAGLQCNLLMRRAVLLFWDKSWSDALA